MTLLTPLGPPTVVFITLYIASLVPHNPQLKQTWLAIGLSCLLTPGSTPPLAQYSNNVWLRRWCRPCTSRRAPKTAAPHCVRTVSMQDSNGRHHRYRRACPLRLSSGARDRSDDNSPGKQRHPFSPFFILPFPSSSHTLDAHQVPLDCHYLDTTKVSISWLAP